MYKRQPLTPEPNDNAPAASAEDFSTPLEPVEKLPEPDDVGSSESADNFETPLVPEPTQPAPAPVTAIPTLGGSFDQGGFDAAKAAWNAGIPVSDLLTGRVSVQAPAPQPTAQPAAAAPKEMCIRDRPEPDRIHQRRTHQSGAEHDRKDQRKHFRRGGKDRLYDKRAFPTGVQRGHRAFAPAVPPIFQAGKQTGKIRPKMLQHKTTTPGGCQQAAAFVLPLTDKQGRGERCKGISRKGTIMCRNTAESRKLFYSGCILNIRNGQKREKPVAGVFKIKAARDPLSLIHILGAPGPLEPYSPK